MDGTVTKEAGTKTATRHVPSDLEIAQAADEIGGQMNAFTAREHHDLAAAAATVRAVERL